MSTLLTACASSGPHAVVLGEVPEELRECFDKFVPAPKRGKMTAQQVAVLVAALKRSELEKSLCGQRLIIWYEAQQAVYNKRR